MSRVGVTSGGRAFMRVPPRMCACWAGIARWTGSRTRAFSSRARTSPAWRGSKRSGWFSSCSPAAHITGGLTSIELRSRRLGTPRRDCWFPLPVWPGEPFQLVQRSEGRIPPVGRDVEDAAIDAGPLHQVDLVLGGFGICGQGNVTSARRFCQLAQLGDAAEDVAAIGIHPSAYATTRFKMLGPLPPRMTGG